VEQVYAEAGTKPRLRAAPKFLGNALGLPNPTMKTLTERLHQTERPFVIDHSRYDHAFGVHPTPRMTKPSARRSTGSRHINE
jgi:hypothetical protein